MIRAAAIRVVRRLIPSERLLINEWDARFWMDAHGGVHVMTEIVVTAKELQHEELYQENGFPERRRYAERRSRHDRRMRTSRGGNDARSGVERRVLPDRRCG